MPSSCQSLVIVPLRLRVTLCLMSDEPKPLSNGGSFIDGPPCSFHVKEIDGGSSSLFITQVIFTDPFSWLNAPYLAAFVASSFSTREIDTIAFSGRVKSGPAHLSLG